MLNLSKCVWLVFMVLCWSGSVYSHNGNEPDFALLQGDICLTPLKPLSDSEMKIQPGTPIKLSMTVENKGLQSSSSGEVYIRYAFSRPLENDYRSIIYQTERVALPPLAPQEKLTVHFEKEHFLPSLIDFVRDDWPMREYQAIVEFNGLQKAIGTLAISVSAYYYPGVKKELPAIVP